MQRISNLPQKQYNGIVYIQGLINHQVLPSILKLLVRYSTSTIIMIINEIKMDLIC